ncbi:MAG: YggT family protein [Sulfurimonas sp.]|uniref:YggT family protein n=1 Tax=Sulfurimonas sp. TaxID=2022749 RepID=UPI00262674A5|nr:YggT family protein [Sulfurimonas sp.]MDD5400154.1 YggT family protein [Sulfurimonas sp.]
MSILVEIIQGVGAIALGLIDVYIWVVIITALLSFVNPDPFNPIVQFLYRITNPAYAFVRKFIKTNFNGLDLAPLIIVVGLQIITVLLRAILRAL